MDFIAKFGPWAVESDEEEDTERRLRRIRGTSIKANDDTCAGYPVLYGWESLGAAAQAMRRFLLWIQSSSGGQEIRSESASKIMAGSASGVFDTEDSH